jgi:serine O-acetyltransferase
MAGTSRFRCTVGRGVTIDHATGVTLGETGVIGDNVYIMHDVTLGATGTSNEVDRHPKIGNGVFLGAKCTVLGNVSVGDGATVAAAALVNKPVPAGHTAVGVPARLIAPSPSKALDPTRAK